MQLKALPARLPRILQYTLFRPGLQPLRSRNLNQINPACYSPLSGAQFVRSPTLSVGKHLFQMNRLHPYPKSLCRSNPLSMQSLRDPLSVPVHCLSDQIPLQNLHHSFLPVSIPFPNSPPSFLPVRKNFLQKIFPDWPPPGEKRRWLPLSLSYRGQHLLHPRKK